MPGTLEGPADDCHAFMHTAPECAEGKRMPAGVTEQEKTARPQPMYRQLPARGRRNVLDHEAVASNQGSRLIGAMIEEVAERGYAGAPLARLVALAGVSKLAFYERFGTMQALATGSG